MRGHLGGAGVSVAIVFVLAAAACTPRSPATAPFGTRTPQRTRPPATTLTPAPSPSPRKATGPKPREKEKRERYHPTGKLVVADGHEQEGKGSATFTYVVEVEEGIKEDPEAFAHQVDDVLFDRRSWPGTFERVDHGPVDFHVILASPGSTDRLCLPLETAGSYSCYQDGNAVLNSMRWKRGASTYGNDLRRYRIYMINHEVGHAIGNGHATCGGSGEKAPVMMQQTKGVAPCVPNPWP